MAALMEHFYNDLYFKTIQKFLPLRNDSNTPFYNLI